MKVSPINNQNQVSYKAVNQKFFKQAKKEFIKYAPHHNQAHLISCITNAVYYRLIARQDAIDTLEAIKPYAQNSIKRIEQLIKDLQANQ